MKKIAQMMKAYGRLLTKWWHQPMGGATSPEKEAVDATGSEKEAVVAASSKEEMVGTTSIECPPVGSPHARREEAAKEVANPEPEMKQVLALLQQMVDENAKIRERIEKLEATSNDAAESMSKEATSKAAAELKVMSKEATSNDVAESKVVSKEAAKQQAVAKKGAADRYAERQQSMLRPIHDMAAFVSGNYEFRHNVVRDIYEYRRKVDKGGGGQEEPWQMVDKRRLNTINCSVQDDGEIFCLSSFVKQRVESGLAVDYHPIRTYLDSVRGQWDGVTDYVGELARRINASDYCERMLRKWLRAVVVQWLGSDSEHANAVMLLLVSERQGLHKSTFLHALMPPEIADYYTDDFSLSSKGNAHRKMVEYAMVSIDEFDKLPHKKMPELKSMMQTLKPSFIGAYKKNFNQLPRIASFVGTSNSRQLLTDRTGSRRFLILEPDGLIPVDGIDHVQLYAQLIDEVERQHLPHYFTKDEEAEMERQNRRYYVENAVERLFLNNFAVPHDKEEGTFVECRELMKVLSERSPKTMEGVTANQFGRYMTRLGVTRGRSHSGDGFIVCQRE